MTISDDGNLYPSRLDGPLPCHVCAEPVAYPGNEYRDVHDECKDG